MKTLLPFLSVLSVVLFLSCKGPQTNSVASNETVKQGVIGKVLWREGDFMPGPNNKSKSVGIVREIFIHEVTGTDQVVQDGQFFKEINSNLVKKVSSDLNGDFQASLDPGTYSIFTKEDVGYFANIYDSENNIFPIVVDSAKVTKVSIIVDYKAAY